jgi:ADP-heptose:LPS heptosyltransferase
VFSHLNIYDPRERTAVGIADALLRVGVGARLVPGGGGAPPRRVLVLRLERIGDLLMVAGALGRLRALVPEAEIDLVVGSWNADIARLLPGVTRVETLDVPWLAREGTGAQGRALAGRGLSWRTRRYDAALNVEGDSRSNLLAALSGARCAGFLSRRRPVTVDRPRTTHQRRTARRCRWSIASPGRSACRCPRRRFGCETRPPSARARADEVPGSVGRKLIGLHTSGGRGIKQCTRAFWRGRRAACARRGPAGLTGAPADRPSGRACSRAATPVIDLVSH